MHMQIVPAPGLKPEPAPGQRTVFRGRPGIVVHALPLLERGAADVAALMAVDLPPFGRFEIVQSLDAVTDSGWRMQLVTSLVSDLEGVRETRLAAVYEVVHWFGFVIAIVAAPAVYEDHRQELLRMFASARPDLRAPEPACIQELWDMTLP